MNKALSIAVLISGSGTTLRNLIEYKQQNRLAAEIKLVISSDAKAAGLAFAAGEAIESKIVDHRDFVEVEDFSSQIFSHIRQANIDLVVMGGFLRRVQIPADFENRVINIHPSLIPAFCGKGSYGRKVHQAVINYGCKISGCTVHFVDDQYDHGPIIAQETVTVLPHDTAESLAKRVFARECEIYPKVINAISSQRLRIHGRKVEII